MLVTNNHIHKLLMHYHIITDTHFKTLHTFKPIAQGTEKSFKLTIVIYQIIEEIKIHLGRYNSPKISFKLHRIIGPSHMHIDIFYWHVQSFKHTTGTSSHSVCLPRRRLHLKNICYHNNLTCNKLTRCPYNIK
jgi:hypothetical protein